MDLILVILIPIWPHCIQDTNLENSSKYVVGLHEAPHSDKLSLGRKLENNLVCDETLASSIKQSIRQRGEKEEQRERTQVQATWAKPKESHKEAKEQIILQSPHQSQEAH
jgi:hypothetical protein